MHTKANIDFTYYNYASGATSIIDHFLLTEQAYDSISNVHVVHSGTNLSDHDPIILKMCHELPGETIRTNKRKRGDTRNKEYMEAIKEQTQNRK